MKISIITASFNNSSTIHDSIDSVLNQTIVRDIEHIVIDGGSTDRTADIIRSYGNKITQFVSEPDNGIYDALNKGIKLAAGDIIGILHADDLFASVHILEEVTAAFKKTDAEAVYGDIVYIRHDRPEKITRIWKAGRQGENWSKKKKPGSCTCDNPWMWGWMPPHTSMFFKRELFEKYGNYRLDMCSAADYELMLRFCMGKAIRLAYLPELIVKMRTGGVSNANLKNRVKANYYDRMAWKVNDMKPYWFTLTLKPLRKSFQWLAAWFSKR
jgi:glycosyltransferase involved in cell wall biosynthesis